MNLIDAFLFCEGRTREEYAWRCAVLVDEAIAWGGRGEKLFIFDPEGMLVPKPELEVEVQIPDPRFFCYDSNKVKLPKWYYHAIAVIAGKAHCPLLPGEALPVNQYLIKYFGNKRLGLTFRGTTIDGNPCISNIWRRVSRRAGCSYFDEYCEGRMVLNRHLMWLRDQVGDMWRPATIPYDPKKYPFPPSSQQAGFA